MDLLLATNGLGMRRNGDVLMVAPAEEIAAQAKVELERRRDLTDLAPRQTEFMRIRYADAAALAAFGSGDGAPAALSAGGSLRVDARTNSLIVSDTADNLAAFKEVIARLDVPVRQVWIEARIVNANSNASEELGVRWRASLDTLGGTAADKNIALRLADETAALGYGILGADYLLDVELSAMAAAGQAEIVARPKVVTADQHTATIESGVEIPYQQATRSGATSIAFKDAVLQLEVTPRITPDEHIVMDLHVKQDTVGRIYHGVPSINSDTNRYARSSRGWRNRRARRASSRPTGIELHRARRCWVTCRLSGGCFAGPWNATTSRSCSYSSRRAALTRPRRARTNTSRPPRSPGSCPGAGAVARHVAQVAMLE